MCQLSRRHRVVTKGWASTTSAFDRSIRWPVDQVCSANADAATSPFWIARRCSDNRCFRVLPDWTVYTLGQPEQGIWYTTPVRWSLSTYSLGRTLMGSHCLSVPPRPSFPPPLVLDYLMTMCWLCASMSSLPLRCVPRDGASQKTSIGWCVWLFWTLRWWGIHCHLFADTHPKTVASLLSPPQQWSGCMVQCCSGVSETAAPAPPTGNSERRCGCICVGRTHLIHWPPYGPIKGWWR